MTMDKDAALSEMKFEFTKMGLVITADRGFDFEFEYRGRSGTMHLERAIERYLQLHERHRRQMIAMILSPFERPDQAGGAMSEH